MNEPLVSVPPLCLQSLHSRLLLSHLPILPSHSTADCSSHTYLSSPLSTVTPQHTAPLTLTYPLLCLQSLHSRLLLSHLPILPSVSSHSTADCSSHTYLSSPLSPVTPQHTAPLTLTYPPLCLQSLHSRLLLSHLPIPPSVSSHSTAYCSSHTYLSSPLSPVTPQQTAPLTLTYPPLCLQSLHSRLLLSHLPILPSVSGHSTADCSSHTYLSSPLSPVTPQHTAPLTLTYPPSVSSHSTAYCSSHTYLSSPVTPQQTAPLTLTYPPLCLQSLHSILLLSHLPILPSVSSHSTADCSSHTYLSSPLSPVTPQQTAPLTLTYPPLCLQSLHSRLLLSHLPILPSVSSHSTADCSSHTYLSPPLSPVTPQHTAPLTLTYPPLCLQSLHSRLLLSHLPIEASLESIKAELSVGSGIDMDDDFMKIVHLRQNLEKVNECSAMWKVGIA